MSQNKKERGRQALRKHVDKRKEELRRRIDELRSTIDRYTAERNKLQDELDNLGEVEEALEEV